jgi:ABC-type uncharacterized transport system permease subunit
MIIGGVFATWVGLNLTGLPGWLVVTLAMLAGFLGGAIWGGIPGVLKAYFSVNEILSTVMMNAIAVQLMNFLLRGPMIDPSQALLASKIPQTARLLEIFRLPRLAPTRLHLGALLPWCWRLCTFFFPYNTWFSHPRSGTKSTRLKICIKVSVISFWLVVERSIFRTGWRDSSLRRQLSHDHRRLLLGFYRQRWI